MMTAAASAEALWHTALAAAGKADWQQGEPDFIGPRFDAAWSGTPEDAELNSKVQQCVPYVFRRDEIVDTDHPAIRACPSGFVPVEDEAAS